MSKESEPIYNGFAKYLEKDHDFQALLIEKSFGPFTEELDKGKVFTSIKKTLNNAGVYEFDDKFLMDILQECDTDKNQKYSETELLVLLTKVMRILLQKMRDSGVFDKMLSEIYDTLDLDSSGTVEYDEIEPFLEKYISMKSVCNPGKEELIKAFNELDQDHNKKLDKMEIAVLVGRITELQFEVGKKALKTQSTKYKGN